jgi:integrase
MVKIRVTLRPFMAPKPTTAARRIALLRNPDVRSWYNDHAKVGTATTQLDQLELFLRRTNLELRELVELAKKPPAKRLKEIVNSFVRHEQAAGRKSRYILNVWWGVRSFLASQAAAPGWNPKIEKTEADEDDVARTVPSHQQLREIASAVKSGRDRAVVLLLASSGLRIGVLATQHAPADGLRLKHLPDLKFDSEPIFEKVPFAVRVPAYLSKGKNAYYTFGSREAADAVLSYLKERIQSGEALTLESPLILPDTRGRLSERRAKDGASFMVRKALAERVKKAMSRVAPPTAGWHAHTLRAWFSTQMESCESKGLVSRTRREFFMGHSLGVDGQYNVERPLSPEKVDELRASYAKCEPFLSTTPVSDSNDGATRVLRALLVARGHPKEDAEKLDIGSMSDTELEALFKKLGASTKRAEKAVAVDEVPRLLDAGWEFVAPLNGSMAVLRSP